MKQPVALFSPLSMYEQVFRFTVVSIVFCSCCCYWAKVKGYTFHLVCVHIHVLSVCVCIWLFFKNEIFSHTHTCTQSEIDECLSSLNREPLLE